MRVVITGASGFIGNTLAQAVLDQGHEVIAADRARSVALADLDVEFAEIDVLDPSSLREAFDGADAVFHLAAIISILGDPDGMVQQVNVQGPRNSAQAALDAGVDRFVHCSSVHAFDLHMCGPSLDETGPRTTGDHAPAYDRSKFAGEQQVQAVIAQGLDAVIVNPTGVFGPRDFGGSRIGETIQQLRSGEIPVTVVGGFDFVDVRDVVQGMLGALERGRTGENYLLSGTRISIRELGQLVAHVTGCKAPGIDVPLGLIKPLAPLVERFTPQGKLPLFTRDSLHALEFSPTVSHYKAAIELGYAARPIHVSVQETIEWLDDHGRAASE